LLDRRTFLAGTGAVLLATPLAGEAQQVGKVWRIERPHSLLKVTPLVGFKSA
jgi:hypothetical protein